MRLLGVFCRWSPLLLLTGATLVFGQEPSPTPAPSPSPSPSPAPTQPPAAPPAQPPAQTPAQPPPATEPTPAEEPPKGKTPLGLYIEAGYGGYDPDTIDSSLQTLSTHLSDNQFEMEEQQFSRAAIGWKLQRDRGEFRLIFNGYSEDGYKLESVGRLSSVINPLGAPGDVLSENVVSPLVWWNVVAENGHISTTRTPPVWDQSVDDANGDNLVQESEARYVGADIAFDTTTFANMQNRAQTYDLVFGNVWGPRRFQGRWFGGFRYFQYDGNIPAAAWLMTPPIGYGYTDGAFLDILNFHQETRGLGPTGLLEARFNFFDQVLQFYLNGQASFVVTDIEFDSGRFTTLVIDTDNGLTIPIDAQLSESQTKSTWHTGAEAGVRVHVLQGLTLEASYGVVGLLDAIVLPTTIRIPQSLQESEQGTSAIYNTQDYVLQGWRAGISYQF